MTFVAIGALRVKLYLMSFFSFSSSGRALFKTLRKSDVFALILEWIYA